MQTLMTIENEGYVKSMKLPSGWVEQLDQRSNLSGQYWHNFGPSGKETVRLCFFDRGRPLSEKGATAVLDALMRGAKVLTPTDLETLSEVLRDAAINEAFDFLNARVETFNGRTVMMIEGRWAQSQEDRLWMIAADETGQWIREIIYQAPKAEYPMHLKAVRESLKTIEWM